MPNGPRFENTFNSLYSFAIDNDIHVWSSKDAKVIAVKPTVSNEVLNYAKTLLLNQ